MVTSNLPPNIPAPTPRRRWQLPTGEKFRDNLTGWLFILPAVVIIFIFGIFPIAYAIYMSTFSWVIQPRFNYCFPSWQEEWESTPRSERQALPQLWERDFNDELMPDFDMGACLHNYNEVIGDWGGLLFFLSGFVFIFIAWWGWNRIFKGEEEFYDDGTMSRFHLIMSRLSGLTVVALLVFIWLGFMYFYPPDFPLISDAISQYVTILTTAFNDAITIVLQGQLTFPDEEVVQYGFTTRLLYVLAFVWSLVAFGYVFYWLTDQLRANAQQKTANTPRFDPITKMVVQFAILAVGLFVVVYGFARMLEVGNDDFLEGLIITLFYAVGSIPLQLALGLVLAYVLYQNIRGKEIYRMIFFLPYITPAVAAATIFRAVFTPRETGLANSFIDLLGFEPQRWIQGADPFVNTMFGWQLEGFLAGPSIALVSVVLLGIWTYVGYNAIIFLAGLGGIPGDLYEAARVDGANDWHIFRHITIPLLSPVTFYLSILGFIGTFKAFNTLFVMRDAFARGTTDTASIVIFDTFYKSSRYGEATAQAVLLMLIILAITQFQRSVLEKRVFYG